MKKRKSNPTTKLIEKYLKAKEAESVARKTKQDLAKQIAEKLGRVVDGQETHTVGEYKVTIKHVINRKVDWSAFDALNLEGHLPVRIKRELDIPGLRWWEKNDPEQYRKLARVITATPGQPQITVKESD